MEKVLFERWESVTFGTEGVKEWGGIRFALSEGKAVKKVALCVVKQAQ